MAVRRQADAGGVVCGERSPASAAIATIVWHKLPGLSRLALIAWWIDQRPSYADITVSAVAPPAVQRELAETMVRLQEWLEPQPETLETVETDDGPQYRLLVPHEGPGTESTR